jgi:hypothetical protein
MITGSTTTADIFLALFDECLAYDDQGDGPLIIATPPMLDPRS